MFIAAQSVSQVKQTQKQPQTMAKSCLNSTEKRVFLNDSETGSHIVQAVISKLRSIQILMCDHRLLRRIALVETNDGINDVPDGGIWAVSKNMFNITSSDVDEVLSNRLCINGAVGNYLKTPLVSGLAASLYLNHLEKSENARIPLAINIEKQADFWIQYYHTGKLTSRYFVEQVQTRESK